MKSPTRRLALIPTVAALLVSVTAALHGTPAINSVANNPSSPANNDTVTVTANVQPSAGSTLSQVQLTYSTSAVTIAPVFQETFGNASTTAGFTGSVDLMNAWTATTTVNAGNVRLTGGISNHTAPIVLTSCSTNTVNGTTTVTCASNAGLIAGMSFSGSINGTSLAATTTIASIPSLSTTTFVLSTPVSADGTVSNPTAAGVSLTGCSLATSPTINCASTTGLSVGMGIAGTGFTVNPANPTVLAVTNATQFTVTSTVTAVPTALTASGVGLVLNTGDATYTHTMATITNPINAGSAASGTVQFYAETQNFVSNNGWTFQVSPDGGTTWNTRISENYAGETVTVTGCTLNATTTVSCTSVAGLSTGMAVQSAALTLTGCTTSSTTNPTVVTTTDTTDLANLAVGMYVVGNGIPGNTHVTAVGGVNGANTFTMSASATASATVTVTANYLPNNAVINTINTTANTFTLNNGTTVFANVSGLTLFATTVNHGFILEQYTLAASELTNNLKFRFQFSGYNPPPPIKAPALDVDDITVTLTTGVAPVTVAMTATGNGNYAAQIPAQAAGTTVSYTIAATDSSGAQATSGASSYTVLTAAPVLSVTPTTGFAPVGVVGGAITPNSLTYTLTNTGPGSMGWTASNTTNWLSVTPAAGTLAAGASVAVTASINANAQSLAAGNYSDVVTFTNTYDGAGNTTSPVSFSLYSIPAAPVLPIAPSFGRGTTGTISWAAITGAVSYTLQISNSASFATVLSSQTVTSPSASFLNLADGATYYYRVLATNPAGSSSYSSVATVTQDATPPSIAITAPKTGATTATASITVTGTSSDSGSGVASVIVNNVPATTGNGFATWSATIPLGFGTNAIKATATDNAGNFTTTAPVLVTLTTAQTYNPLFIPDTMTGTTFNLTLDQSTKQYFPGPATATYGYNNSLFWGPTLIMNQGDFVQINLTNNLVGTTTTHWHGFHIPAIMDGGPHETIPAGTVWSPSFYVKNSAGTYWYHPHLHPLTQQQLTLGAGGMIIVRDPQEAALPLPRSYGVDDIPVVLTSRRFVAGGGGANQFQLVSYGDFPLVNGTLSAQVSLPAQVVRLRILNAEIQRSHYLGFSDNRTFYVIATDGGLVNNPVPVTRLQMAVAERYEILVNLTGVTPGTTLDLKTYNSVFATTTSYPGGPGGTTPPTGSLLNGIDYTDLHINVVSPTANPITSIPATLANNVYWTAADVTNSRTVNITGAGGAPLAFDNLVYSPSVVNESLNLNAVEQWTVTNLSGVSHSFHIHDIEFYPTAFSGGVPANMQGWKDTIYVQQGTSVSFIAKFDGFASNINPFMFHCHFLNHEDAGLMGQFVVSNQAAESIVLSSFTRTGANTAVVLPFTATAGTTYAVEYAANLTSGSWTPVGLATSDGTTATFTETNTTRLAQTGYYRVALPAIAVASFTRDTSDPLIHLQFQATAGTTYAVQYSPDMTTGSWLNVGSITSDGTSGDFYETNLARLALGRGFYRVTIPVIAQ